MLNTEESRSTRTARVHAAAIHRAESHYILERARFNNNAVDSVSPLHTSHRADRFSFSRFS